MSKSFTKQFTFGSIVAETDLFLEESYFDTGNFEVIASLDEAKCFVIGRTGSGKSATFKHLEVKFPGKVIRIVPEHLAFSYITNHDAVQQLSAAGINLDPFYKQLWKHFIFVNVLRHRYPETTQTKRANIMADIIEKIRGRGKGETLAIEYLEAYGDKFWSETTEPMTQIADTIKKKISATAGAKATFFGSELSGSTNAEKEMTHQETREVKASLQRIISDPQINVLNKVDLLLNEYILDSTQHKTYLVMGVAKSTATDFL